MRNENLYSLIDFQFAFSEEMIEANGEDSFYADINENYSVLSVFDGCGGLGSKEYDNFNGKTGQTIIWGYAGKYRGFYICITDFSGRSKEILYRKCQG